MSRCQPNGVFGACACEGPNAAGTGQVPAAGRASVAGSSAPSVGTAGTGAPTTVAGAGVVSTAGVGGASVPTPAAGTGGTAAPSGEYGSWPMMGYDARNNYHNPKETILSVENAPMLKEKWRAKVQGFPPGTPIVADGRVFVHASGGTFAFALSDGKKLWERIDLKGTSSMAYGDGFVYVHAYTTDLHKLDAATGKDVWGPVRTFDVNGCDGESSPILGGGMVFVGHSCGPMETATDPAIVKFELARGGVEAFDIQTGMRAWTYFTVPTTGENGAMVWSTVSVDVEGNALFAGTGNNYSVQGENSDAIHAVDMKTGTKLWKTQVNNNDTWSIAAAFLGPDTDFGANPILADIDGMTVVADGEKGSGFHVMDRKTGAIVWQRRGLSSNRNAQNGGILMNGAWDGKYFYVIANQPPAASVLHALDPRMQGADGWPAKTFNKLAWGAPAVANGVLAVPNGEMLTILNAMTGDKLAEFNTGGTIAAGSPAIVDGHIVVASGLQYDFAPEALFNDEIVCYSVPGAKAPDVAAGNPGTMTPTFVPGSATWAAIFNEIISGTGCNGGPSCHASLSGGNLVMLTKDDAYNALVGVKAMGRNAPGDPTTSCADTQLNRVTPNDPANSILLDKVEAATPKCGTRMPPSGPISAAQIKQIRDWIMAGALNN